MTKSSVERGRYISVSRLQSTLRAAVAGTQGGLLKQRPRGMLWLTGSRSSPTYTAFYRPRPTTIVIIILPSGKCPTDSPTGRSDVGNSSVEVTSSQVTTLYQVKQEKLISVLAMPKE